MKRIIIITVIMIITVIVNPSTALGVVNPQSGSAAVTATVPDRGRPDTPVLISPGNNAVISTAAPTFIFNPSLGDRPVSHYQLWLDGAKNTDHIPQSYSTITAQALAALAPGSHTWMIKAIAANGSDRDSAIWSFSIDTTAPLILVNEVAGQPFQGAVSFSTADRYPLISGQSEAGAMLSISFNNETVSTQIGADRLFNLKPKTALLPGRYTVSISASDQAGNSTSLPSFYLDIVSGAGLITIPLPSPLPDLKFTVPVIVPLSLPQIITAFPLQPGCACTWWPWLIVILLIIYIIISKRRR